MNKKISVIVPAYNREEKIERCIDSLLVQTYPHMEIIIINDGSTDGTKEILDRYEKEYRDKLVVIHTENQGVSEARNEGLRVRTGDYIGFVDSDDYIDKDMYQKLIEKAEENEYDLVACETMALYPHKEMQISSAIETGQDNKKLLIDAYAVLWNKIYKSELLNEIEFKKAVWYEDVLFLYKLYPRCKKVASIPDIGYYYVQNEGSITYTYNEKLYQLIQNWDDILTYYKKCNIYEMYKEELEYSYVRYLYGTFVKRLVKSKDYKKVQSGIKAVQWKVNGTFPQYKKNSYLNRKGLKNKYLKYFNKQIGILVYLREKNRMN